MSSPAELYLNSLSLAFDMVKNILATVRADLGRLYLAVDAGCGPGNYIKPLLSIMSPGGKVIAIDSSQEMLDVVRQKQPPSNLRKVDLVHADIEDMRTVVSDADLILCASSLQFTKVDAAFAAIYQSLAHHGVLVFSMPMGLQGILEEHPEGAYAIFQEIFHNHLMEEVSRRAPHYPMANVAARRPDRNINDFLGPCREAGFTDNHIYVALQIVPASKLAVHLSVPWRAERFVPGLEQKIQQECIRRAIDRSLRQMKLDKNFPFPRDIVYVVAKKSLVR